MLLESSKTIFLTKSQTQLHTLHFFQSRVIEAYFNICICFEDIDAHRMNSVQELLLEKRRIRVEPHLFYHISPTGALFNFTLDEQISAFRDSFMCYSSGKLPNVADGNT